MVALTTAESLLLTVDFSKFFASPRSVAASRSAEVRLCSWPMPEICVWIRCAELSSLSIGRRSSATSWVTMPLTSSPLPTPGDESPVVVVAMVERPAEDL